MKKLLTLLMATVLMLSMASTALADDFVLGDETLTITAGGEHNITMKDGLEEATGNIVINVDNEDEEVTLNFNGVKLNTEEEKAISVSSPLKSLAINATGDASSITGANIGIDANYTVGTGMNAKTVGALLAIIGDADLTINAGGGVNVDSEGIFSNGDIVINSTGKLNITSSDVTSSDSYYNASYGIYSNGGTVRFTGSGEVTLSSGAAPEYSAGVRAGTVYIVDNANVNTTGGAGDSGSYGVYATAGTYNETDGSNSDALLVTASLTTDAVYAAGVTVSGGTVIAENISDMDSGCKSSFKGGTVTVNADSDAAISLNGSLTISTTVVNATATSQDDEVISVDAIWVNGDLTIDSNANVTATSVGGIAIKSDGALTLGFGTVNATGKTGAIVSGGDMTFGETVNVNAISSDGTAINSGAALTIGERANVKATGKTGAIASTGAMKFDSSVIVIAKSTDGTAVKSESTMDITNSANVTATSVNEVAVHSVGVMDINYGATVNATTTREIAVYSYANMTIANGSSVNATSPSNVIFANGDLEIYDAIISATSIFSEVIKANGDLDIAGSDNGTSIMAKSSNLNAIYAGKTLTLTPDINKELTAKGFGTTAYTEDVAIDTSSKYFVYTDDSAVVKKIYIGQQAPDIAIDYVNEKLTGFEDGKDYEIGSSVTPVNGELDVEDYIGSDINIKFEGGKVSQTLTVPARPDAPEVEGGDRTITGLTTDMEYSADGKNWTAVTDEIISEEWTAGEYEVRTKAVADTSFASESAKVTVTDSTVKPSTGGVKKYTNTLEVGKGGEAIAQPLKAAAGTIVWITPTADAEYEIEDVIVDDGDVKVTAAGDGTFSFKQPARAVVIEVTFEYVGEVAPVDPSEFDDVKENSWYKDYVDEAVDKDIMQGNADGSFDPNGIVSRAMMVTVVHNLEGKPVVNYLMPFADVAGDAWYAEAVRWASSEGVVLGVSDTEYAPNANVTREQLVAMLFRYAMTEGEDTSAKADLAKFADSENVAEYAVPAMEWAVAEDIINGDENGNLNPQGFATRAELAKIMVCFINK